MDELISVIVPIYKTEKYLRKCVESILNQTYQNLEIILVNDGSPDNSGLICDEYAKKDKRIKVIHQKNSGISVVMNNALDLATGEMIATVDSDDYIHEQFLEILLKNLKEYDADISVCNFTFVNDNEKYKTNRHRIDKEQKEIAVLNRKEALGKLYGGSFAIHSFAWNKLYKKCLFENIRYLEGKMYEDIFIAHRLLDKASKVVVTECPLYYYLIRHDSITGETFNFSRLYILEALEDRMTFSKDRGYNELFDQTHKVFLEFAIAFYYMTEEFYPEEKERLVEIKNKFVKTYKKHNNEELSKTTKIRYDLFCINPLLQKWIINLHVFMKSKILRNIT